MTPKEKQAARSRKHYLANKEKMLAANKKWRAENKERKAKADREWAKNNPERRRKYAREWGARNRGTVNFHTAKYRAKRLQATPPWSEAKQIRGLYKLANWLTQEYGRVIHVDHIVPLQGEEVSGLHCMDNLQLLFAEDNLKKGNTHSIG